MIRKYLHQLALLLFSAAHRGGEALGKFSIAHFTPLSFYHHFFRTLVHVLCDVAHLRIPGISDFRKRFAGRNTHQARKPA
jgi:hypothetical protein